MRAACVIQAIDRGLRMYSSKNLSREEEALVDF